MFPRSPGAKRRKRKEEKEKKNKWQPSYRPLKTERIAQAPSNANQVFLIGLPKKSNQMHNIPPINTLRSPFYQAPASVHNWTQKNV